ncbi:uncharacterized [Tachysurus ichikawai]
MSFRGHVLEEGVYSRPSRKRKGRRKGIEAELSSHPDAGDGGPMRETRVNTTSGHRCVVQIKPRLWRKTAAITENQRETYCWASQRFTEEL